MTKTFIFLIEMSFRCLFWSVAKDKRNRELILLRKENQILKRKLPKPQFTNSDRLFYICLFKYAKEIVKKVSLIKPETILRWHKNRCQKKWTYPSRSVGRHPVDENIRSIVIEMKQANPRWGSQRISGELWKVGISLCKKTVAKILKQHGFDLGDKKRAVGWFEFLRSQSHGVYLACDFFTVETIMMEKLFVFFVINVKTKEIIVSAVTKSPNRCWLENVLRTSFCFYDNLPKVMVSDRDWVYGSWLKEFLQESFKIKLIRTPPRQPVHNCFAERMVRTFREELTDRIIVYNRPHLSRVVSEYVKYYNEDRIHSSLCLSSPKNTFGFKKVEFNRSNVVRRKLLGGMVNDFSLAG